MERDIILKNPFRIKEIKVSVGVAEKHYAEESTIEAIVDSLPEDKLEWKLLFKLARYLGLRMPSEIRELIIEDVDWGTNTITLKSPKTKRYGKGTRRVPIFVEIEVSVGVAEKDYVEEASIQATIDCLPADKLDWKLLFAFARYVGCRMPSEIEKLSWDDIDWEANTILIRSPKTGNRRVPTFSEIQSLLFKQASAVPDGTVYVFPKQRTHSNLATTAKKYVQKAEVEPWSEFWNSVRASRETDLMDSHGLRRACAWIGNSPSIAMKHYSLMRKSDYIDAGKVVQKSDAKSDGELPRNRAHGEEQKFEDPGILALCGSGKESSTPKEDKRSLGLLWHAGKLAIDSRLSFRKQFDLAERVYPVDTMTASLKQYHDSWLLIGLRGNGFASESHLKNYWTAPYLNAEERRAVI